MQEPLTNSGPTVPPAAAPKGKARRVARQERLLARLDEAAQLCAAVEQRLRECRGPELETFIKLFRLLVMEFSMKGTLDPATVKKAPDLLKPLLALARLEEVHEKRGDNPGARKALRRETLKQIERELNLLGGKT